MANITKRIAKDGSLSYLVRVYAGETTSGKQLFKSMTYNPPAGMRPTSIEKEVLKQAALFEERVKSGLAAFGGNTSFKEYAEEWIKNEPLSPKTRETYEYLMRRINQAIGHIKLEKLQARHLEEFYRNLSEPGVSERGRSAKSDKLAEIIKENEIKRVELANKAGISPNTLTIAAKGENVSIKTASAISEALGKPFSSVFTVINDNAKLSQKSIVHYHRLISTILEKAKKERIIPFNVAAEHVNTPKLDRKEAKYMDDVQARRFLSLLSDETDIRVKTALTLALFTGVRRGELCGLSWNDIDTDKRLVHVRRASQYQKGVGIVEVPTKTAGSVRDISVPQYVIDLLKIYKTWWLEQKLFCGKDWKGQLDRLFIQEDGGPINPDTINFWLDRFISKHNLPRITVHGLRHTFATLQITSGVDIRTLQARTGHAQASTLTDIYSHAIASAQEAASNALADVLLPKAGRKQA
jgi:integrase